MTVLWISANPLLVSSSPLEVLSRVFALLSRCSNMDSSHGSMITVLVIVAVVFVFSLSLLTAILVMFSYTRAVPSPLRIPVRIVVEIVPLVIAFPYTFVTAQSLIKWLREDSRTLAYLLISALELIFFVSVLWVSSTCLGCSLFLPSGPFCFYSPLARRAHVIGSLLLFGASVLSASLSTWLMFVVIAVHIVHSVYVLWGFCHFPCVGLWYNYLRIAISVSCVLMDVCAICFRFSVATGQCFLPLPLSSPQSPPPPPISTNDSFSGVAAALLLRSSPQRMITATLLTRFDCCDHRCTRYLFSIGLSQIA
jgi:hypothetical protein